jgi:hypothetical protein
MADSKNPKPLPEGYDPELEKANKGYAEYEKKQSEAQKKLDAEDAAAKEKVKNVVEKVKGAFKFKSGGSVSSASKRADGCAIRGKTKGRMV